MISIIGNYRPFLISVIIQKGDITGISPLMFNID